MCLIRREEGSALGVTSVDRFLWRLEIERASTRRIIVYFVYNHGHGIFKSSTGYLLRQITCTLFVDFEETRQVLVEIIITN